MQNATNKKADPVEILVAGFFKGIAAIFRSMFYGIKRLNNVKLLLGLLFFSIAAAGAYTQRELIFRINAPVHIQWLIYSALLALPLLYLYVLGISQSKAIREYYIRFSEINFMGKDKKYPVLLYKKEDGKKEILAFKSNIPMETWKKSTPQLETAFDCTITNIQQKHSKKKVQLTTISSSHAIPTLINWSDEYIVRDKDGAIIGGIVVIGENAYEQITFNLNRTPHMLAAGETGSGKSVILRLILWQLANGGAIIFMLDFKGGVEFGIEYEKYGEVITERKKAIKLLELLVEENKQRLAIFREKRAKNLDDYNKKTGENLTRIGVFCDEIAEMLDKKGATGEDKEDIDKLTGYLSTLARLSRATGINLFMGVQRPDANVLTGQIKNNVPIRICGRFADKTASEIVLGNTKATELPDVKGRFLYKVAADTIPFQSYFFDDDTMLHELDIPEQIVMCSELQKCLVSSQTAEAPELHEPQPEKPQAPAARKPYTKGKTGKNITELNFDYRKAVNK